MEVIVYLGLFIAGIFITRWVFRMDLIIGYQRKQYEITKAIALIQGVKADTINDIEHPEHREEERRGQVKKNYFEKHAKRIPSKH